MDMREKMFFSELPSVLRKLKRRGEDYRIVFLDAADQVLVRRYKETRRLHPIGGEDLDKGIEAERGLLRDVKKMAHRVIDTSDLNPHQLRDVIFDYFRESLPEKRLNLTIVSFGYRYGAPSDADIVMDVRFLPNPYFVEDLKPLSGLDPKVQGIRSRKGRDQGVSPAIRETDEFSAAQLRQGGQVVSDGGGGMHWWSTSFGGDSRAIGRNHRPGRRI